MYLYLDQQDHQNNQSFFKQGESVRVKMFSVDVCIVFCFNLVLF